MPATSSRRKIGSDQELLRLNSLGLSLSTIASILGCHYSSVSLRLKAMNVAPIDTRKPFMEAVLGSMPEEAQSALVNHLETDSIHIRDYVRDLIVKDLMNHPLPQDIEPANVNSERAEEHPRLVPDSEAGTEL